MFVFLCPPPAAERQEGDLDLVLGCFTLCHRNIETQGNEKLTRSQAVPGLFFCFACMVLLLFASVSPPAWNAVNFLKAGTGSGETVYGVFGQCVKGGSCSHRNVCYNLNALGAE